jgi:glutamate-5-semialdehyde dehydrogenase
MTQEQLIHQATACRAASAILRRSTIEQRNAALVQISRGLLSCSADILAANERDVKRAQSEGLSAALIDRLLLTEERIGAIASSLGELVALADPLSVVLDEWERPNGLRIQKVRVPLGVVGMVYEARPNVTVDSAAICLKSGNTVVLRGSRSTIESNIALVGVIQRALEDAGLPASCVELVTDTSPEVARVMMELHGLIDVLIPRGGARLIQEVRRNARIPVLETGEGNCHLYIHESARTDWAIAIAINGKTSRPSVCNALETILIDEAWAVRHLEELVKALVEKGVECRGCARSRELVASVILATEEDYAAEFLDLRIALRVVTGLPEALDHIARYSTHHSEAIVAEDKDVAQVFLTSVDAAAVYHNASTRFTDGGEFGFGAEIGISTQKLHARGPMGLPELCSYTYLIRGEGQIR